MPNVGSRILYWRLKRGLSRLDVARGMGWSEKNYNLNQYEEQGLGEDARLKTLRRLAAALEVSVGDLVEGDLPSDASDVLAAHGYEMQEAVHA